MSENIQRTRSGSETTRPLGLYIPPHIYSCPGLTPFSLIFLGLVYQLNDAKRGCYASLDKLAATAGIKRRTLTRMVAELQSRGLLVRKGRTMRPAKDTDPAWTRPVEAKASPWERGRPARKTPAAGKPDYTQAEVLTSDLGSDSEAAEIKAIEVPKPSAEVTELSSPTGEMRAGRPRSQGEAPRTRKTSPLEDKLVEICGLETLVGTKAFPGSRFGKSLSILRELNATPEELGRYLAWWSDQAISYKRDYPTLEQVSGTFHQSRTSNLDTTALSADGTTTELSARLGGRNASRLLGLCRPVALGGTDLRTAVPD